jgi:hypothetical protein
MFLVILLLLILLLLTVIVFSTGESSSYTSTNETKRNKIYINQIMKNTTQKIQIAVNTLTYITETPTQLAGRQSNNQWSGGIAACYAMPQKFRVQKPLENSRLYFLGSRQHPPQ